jgi:hypothetical protein
LPNTYYITVTNTAPWNKLWNWPNTLERIMSWI